jgi:uncharacterized protein (TIGR03118 family)
MLRVRALLAAVGVAVFALVAVGGAGAHRPAHMNTKNRFIVQDLVSDQPGVAVHTDSNLVNAWGLAASAGSPWWVADNGTNVSTVYDASGNAFPPPPAAPLAVGVSSAPTGAVASTDSAFVVGAGQSAGPAKFIFDTEDGHILAWHPGLAQAMVTVDASGSHAVFKGLALMNDRLYATDFHNRHVDVYDANFAPVPLASTAFVDPGIPANFAPFGIQAIDGSIYVTYAEQDSEGMDDVDGHGLGYVDEYDPNGQLIARVAGGGPLNAPWGLAWAPAVFGRFGGELLVGNFGNGTIHAYAPNGGNNPTSFHLDGRLKMSDGSKLKIDGLWSLQFGLGGANNGSTSTLFFTAGPNDENDGLFGTITAP